MKQDSEEALISKALKDPAAFAALYELYFDRIFNFIFRRVGKFNLANDIASEVFFKAFKNFPQFKWRGIPVSAWFYRIANNEVNLYFRRKSYRPETVIDAGADFFLQQADPDSFEEEKSRAERAIQENNDFEAIRSEIAEMDLKYQEVLTLRYFEKKSIHEVSQILGKKEGTVKSLISRGLQKLRTKFG